MLQSDHAVSELSGLRMKSNSWLFSKQHCMGESGGVWCVFLTSFVPGAAAACPVLEEAFAGWTGAVDFLVWCNLS